MGEQVGICTLAFRGKLQVGDDVMSILLVFEATRQDEPLETGDVEKEAEA